MDHWRFASFWYFLAVLSLVIGVILMFSVFCRDAGDACAADRQTYQRATLFLLAAVAFGVLGVLQTTYDA